MANLQIVIVARNMAGGALRELGGDLGRLDNNAGVASRGISGLSTAVRTGLVAAAGLAVTGVGALGAGMLLAANKAGDFESQINILGVAASSTGTSMEDLSAAALAVGSDSDLVGISASQAADAMTNFYRAGLTTTDVFGDLQGYLAGTTPLTGALRSAIDLAAASELDLAQASDVVSVAMATFGLSAGDAATIANSLVGAADASVASVGGLSDALINVGPVAASMGMSLNDTNIALALLSTRGIQGSEAGTALRSMLLHLQSGTPAVTAALDALNVSLYDQQGNMLPLPNIIGQLQTAFGGLTQEQQNQYAQTLAGTYGLGALNTLVGEGLPGWDAMATAVSNAASAQEVAGARTQGFNAAMEQLGGVIETFLISVGTPLIENFLTPGVQALGEWIGNLTTLAPTTEGVSTAFQTLLGYGQQLLTWLGNTLGPVLELVGQFVSWQDVLIVLGGVITAVLIAGLAGIVSAAAPVIAVFAGLVLAVAAVRTAWETDFGGIRTFVEGVVATITTILGGLSTYIQTNSAEATGWITQAWTQIQTFIGTAVAAIDGIVRGILGPIQTFLQTHSAEIQGFLITAWETIGSIVTGVLEVLQLTVGTALTAIAGFLQTHSAEIEAIISTVWTVISSIIEGTLNTINGIVQTALAILRGDWDGAWAALQGIVQTQLDTVRTVVETVLGPIATWIAGKLEEIRTFFETKWAAVKTAVESKIAEIRQAIETWLTNTLNTIQNFDLGAAARALFEKVVTGIAAKAGDALARVATFLDNAFLAIESFDLQAAAQTFFGTTLPGIAAKAGEALNKVGEWLSRVGSDIAAKDLEGQAKSWFGTVVPGILAKATEALSKVGEWLSQTAQKISQFDLLAAAKTLFGTIIPGLMAKAGEILSKLGDVLSSLATRIREKDFKSHTMTAIATVVSGILAKVGDILTAVGGFLTDIADKISEFSLFDAGANLIQGFISGIGSMVGGAIAAAADVVQQAIAAAWAAVQPGSPSRVGDAIGANLVEGMVVGVSRMAGALVNAMSGALGDVTIAAMEQGVEIASAVGSIVDTMTGLIEAAGALAAFEVPDGLSAAIDAIALEIAYVISVFLDTVAQFEADAVSAAADFADDAGSVLDVFSAGVDLIAQLANYTEVNIGPAAEMLVLQMQGLVQKLARVANELGPEVLASAAAAGALFEQAMAPWQAGVDAVAAIATYTAVVIGPAAETLVLQMQGLTQKLARVANELGPEALQAAATTGGLLEQAMAPWQAGIAVVEALAAHTTAIIGPAAEILLLQMAGLARKMARISTEIGPEALQAAVTFAQAIGQLVGFVEPSIDAIKALAEYTRAVGLGEATAAFATDIATVAFQIKDGLETFRGMTPDALAAAVAMSQAIGQLVGFVKPGLDAIKALAEYTRATGVGEAAAAFGSDIVQLVTSIANALSAGGTQLAGPGIEAAVVFMQAAGTIGQNVGHALSGLNALLAYVGGVAQTSLDAFVADMVMLVQAMATASALFTEDGLAAAVNLATAAGTIGQNVGQALQGLSALLTYVGGVAQTSLDAFVADMVMLVQAMATASALFTEDGLAAAVNLATAAGTIGQNVGQALAGLSALLTYQGGNAQAALNRFVGDMSLVISALTTAASSVNVAGLATALAFASDLGTLATRIQTAVSSLRGIVAYEGGAAVTAFNAFLADINTINQRIASSALAMGTALTSAQQFAATGLAIGTALSAGIAAATTPPAGASAALLLLAADIAATVAVVSAQYTLMQNAAWTFGYQWVNHIMAGLNNRLPDLVALMAYIRGLFPSSPAKYGPWRKLPKGAVVGSGFGRDLATGLGGEADRVTKAMRLLRDNVTLSPSFAPALSSGGVRGYPTPMTDPFSSGNSFGFAPKGKPPVVITISNNTFSSRQDIDYLMDEMERRLELQGAFRL